MIIKKKRDFNPEEMNNDELKGVKYYPFISAGDGAPTFAMRLFELSSGGHTPHHDHSWEHEVYITSGNGFVLRNNEKIFIEKDNCIFINGSEKHQFIAGENGLSFICVVPNEGQACVVKKK